MLNKREYENGINDTLTEMILKENPDMIITADHGSSSGVNLDRISDAGIKVIVTDHHELSLETPPNKYVAFINPQRPDCKYDKSVSGCSVAYLLVLAIAKEFNIDFFSKDMQNILAIAAITVISDSMKLNSITNRAIVKTGLKIVNSFKTDNWIRLMAEEAGLITYKALGWRISPLMNSASRMGDPEVAYKIFMEKDDKSIREVITAANSLNTDRKRLQEEMEREANDEYMIDRGNKFSSVSRISNGLGIQGIIASRFVNNYKMPAVMFYHNKANGTYQGSGRSNGRINLLEVLRNIERKFKSKVLKLGGHKEAAGITIKEDFYSEFKLELDKEIEAEENVSKHFDTDYVDKNIHMVDMELDFIDYEIYDSIQLLSPYGIGWSIPLFSTIFLIKRVTKISRPKSKEMYILELWDKKNVRIESVYFPVEEMDFELKERMLINVIYELEYSGVRNKGLSLMIKDISEY